MTMAHTTTRPLSAIRADSVGYDLVRTRTTWYVRNLHTGRKVPGMSYSDIGAARDALEMKQNEYWGKAPSPTTPAPVAPATLPAVTGTEDTTPMSNATRTRTTAPKADEAPAPAPADTTPAEADRTASPDLLALAGSVLAGEPVTEAATPVAPTRTAGKARGPRNVVADITDHAFTPWKTVPTRCNTCGKVAGRHNAEAKPKASRGKGKKKTQAANA